MPKRGKKYEAIAKQAPEGAVEIDEAVRFVKANAAASFDETVDMALRMGLDSSKSENTIRGTVVLPHGTGRPVKVVVFATGAAAVSYTHLRAHET